MRILLLLGGLLAMSATSFAQTNFFSQYQQHPFIANPAYAGYQGDQILNLWNRNSYSRFTNINFTSAWAAYNTPIGADGTQGFGLHVFLEQEQFGFGETAGANAVYAFNVAIDDKTDLRMGLGMGFGRRADSILVAGGGGIFGTDVNWYGSLSAGLLLATGNWEFGIGAHNANQPRYTLDFGQSRVIRQILYGIVTYKYEVQEGLVIQPGLQIRRIGQERTLSIQADTDIRLMDKFTIGAGLRVSRFGQSAYFINGIQYNSNINYFIARVGADLSGGVTAFVSYDTPLRSNSLLQPASIIFGFLEAGFAIRFSEL